MKTKSLFLTLAVGFGLAAGLTSSADAQPADVGPFLGTFKTKGKQGWRTISADIEISRSDAGVLSIKRVARFKSRRYRRNPEFSYESQDVKLEGDVLKVVYRIAKDGRSLHVGNVRGLAEGLDGESVITDSAGEEVQPDQINVFNAEYKLQDDGTVLREKIRNTTKKKPEDYWRNARTKGDKLTSTDPGETVVRIKLGDTVEVTNGTHNVVIPTDGTLTLEISGGKISLKDPSGNALTIEGATDTNLTYEIPSANPVLGVYKVVVEGAGADEVLEAKFVQDGRIDKRIRPWSSHTYYPINEFSWGSSENRNTMFKKGGALDTFDKVLNLEGRESAVWWERGTDYRTSFGFERGHYVKVSSPTEENAEEEWNADLDGDGVMEIESAEDVFKAYDTNADGKVDEAEAKEQLWKGQIKKLWSNYDNDGDGQVTSDDIFEEFVTSADTDSSGGVSFEEWAAKLRKDYVSLLDGRTKAALEALMAKDSDADGLLVVDDMGTPGALDFQDSSDVDGDFNSFFDRDNIKITTKSGDVHYGNKVEEEGDTIKLFKGRKKDELVVELNKDDVEKRENGIADGDLDDSYSVGWWGHCNAWAMASIVFRKPAEEFESGGETLSIRDQKGMLVEFGMGDTEESTFWWKRAGDDEIDPRWYAAGFHRQMHRWLRVEQKGMMADMDMKDPNNNLKFQVWNYPLLGYVAELKEAEGDNPYVLDVDCTIEKGSYSDEDSSSTASVTYTLQFNEDGSISEADDAKTAWTQKRSGNLAYIRYLIHPYRFTSRGTSGNPNVTLERLQKVFGDRLKYNNIEDIEAEEAADGGLPTEAPAATTTPDADASSD